MTRLANAMRLELTLQVRQKFLHAGVFSGLLWLAVLLPMPVNLRPVAEPYVLVGDIAIIGYLFIGALVFFEKQERTIGAIVSTPLRFWEYLVAKLTVLVLISLFVAVTVATVTHRGFAFHVVPLVVGVVLGTLVFLMAGFISSLPFASVTDWFLAATIPLAVLSLPILYYSGLWPNPVLYLIPTQGPLLLLGEAFDQVTLAPWQVMYAVLYPLLCVAGSYFAAKVMFGRYVVERSGVL
jgi:fluoroquinolone transport system permease protein